MELKHIGLQDIVYGLIFSLQSEGKSARTIEYYKDLLRTFLQYARSSSWPDDVNSLDATQLRAFLLWVVSRAHKYDVGNGTTLNTAGKTTYCLAIFPCS